MIIMKQDLVRILRDIFTSSGYDVTDSFRYDLIAEKNDLKTFIKLSYNPDPLEVKEFASQITEGEGLYVIAGEANEEALRQAEASGLKVWSRDDLALKIGRAVLADMEGATGEFDLLETARKKPVNMSDEFAKQAINAIFGTGTSPHVEKAALEDSGVMYMPKPAIPAVERVAEVKYYRPRSMPYDSVPEETEILEAPDVMEEAPVEAPVAPVQNMPMDSVIMNLRSSPVNVSGDRALSIAIPYVSGATTAVLKFVPFWKYDYSLGVEHRYKSKIIDISGDGSGCLNALNGNSESMRLNDVRESVVVPNVHYDVKTPVTTGEEARKQLLDMIVDEYTRDLRFDATQGEAIISEHKRFKPLPTDINLQVDLVYVPIWEVKGQRNSVEINAYSGEVLQNPVDDDVEFV
ncbi:hypothetical protein RE476_10685 [Methanolobus mangrovi]|uniref:Uncharacterized protein n=1 Tax=Methanolobus mangrovi TaxID=3072977 RepID=A0AA51UES8_9EURY|nr:hypothetical protein [Methanolobus mangrovi]WMW21831.1 hypothetical protein RE476_10685 [Methanolobus mangrovi]